MKPFRSWKHPAGDMTVLLLTVAAVSVVARVWMGVRLAQQDRALEAQQLGERREAAADRVVAGLEQVLLGEERRLADASSGSFSPAADDALLFAAGPADVRVWPENALLYYPVTPDSLEAPPRLYAAAERSEFLDRDYEGAIGALRPLSHAEDPAVRAGAQLRLARNLRKAGRLETALQVYEVPAKLPDPAVAISGVPVGLVACRARCDLLERLGHAEQLRAEAGRLDEGLRSGHWRLDRGSYLYYSSQAARWVPPRPESGIGRQALAEALTWLWRNWQSTRGADPDAAGRRSLRINGTSVVVLWHASGERLAAKVAGPRYQKSQWFEPLDAGRLAQSVVDEFRQETNADGFLIECSVPKNGAPVKGDQDALMQALWNLLDNAVKYSGDSRKVCIEVETGSQVAIRVRDEGFGIQPSERDQIMRKFARGSAAKTHNIKGTGIGLAMVKHIVDPHGGKVLVDSEPGRGSTFTIQLPAGG
jgi:anti-sigma regulatory factor (Ser/Thr protein kinase)